MYHYIWLAVRFSWICDPISPVLIYLKKAPGRFFCVFYRTHNPNNELFFLTLGNVNVDAGFSVVKIGIAGYEGLKLT